MPTPEPEIKIIEEPATFIDLTYPVADPSRPGALITEQYMLLKDDYYRTDGATLLLVFEQPGSPKTKLQINLLHVAGTRITEGTRKIIDPASVPVRPKTSERSSPLV